MGVKAGKQKPFFPALHGEMVLESGLSLADATQVVRVFIVQASSAGSIPASVVESDYATQSGKRTCMYWLALSGAPLDERRLLGHHVVRTDASWLAYSVEALTPLVAKLQEVIDKVATGDLKPKMSMLPGQDADEETQDADGRDEDKESDSSASGSEDSSEQGTAELASAIADLNDAASRAEEEVNLDPEVEVYRHARYGTQHLRLKRETSLEPRLKCGRKLGPSFVLVEGDHPSLTQRCAVCFAGASSGSGRPA